MIDLTSIAFRSSTYRMHLIPLVDCRGFIAMLAINGVPESLASTLLASITSTSTALLSTSTKKCQNKPLNLHLTSVKIQSQSSSEFSYVGWTFMSVAWP